MRNTPYLGFGLGLRNPHYKDVLKGTPKVDWLEVISENFLGRENLTAGPGLDRLLEIREKYPIVLHGVSLSIGSADPLNKKYMKRVKDLYEVVKPVWVSDHLCWTGVHGLNAHDLLPIPYTKSAIRHIVGRVKAVQDFYGRQILLENVSSYAEFSESTYTEWEFLAEVADKSDSGILLDVNNVYVSSFNHGFDPYQYLKNLPHDRIQQIHLAGHTNKGRYLIDTHDHPVVEKVWQLYEWLLQEIGPRNTMIERDDHIPPFEELVAELDRARALVKRQKRTA